MANSDDGTFDAAKCHSFRLIIALAAFMFIAVLTSMCVLSDDSDVSAAFSVDDIWYEDNGNDTVTVVAGDYTGVVDIPNTVTYNSVTYRVTAISPTAFVSCLGLTSVTIPAGVTALEKDYFWKCSRLTSVNVDAGNTKYSSRDGVVFDKYGLSLLIFPFGKGSSYSIPDGTLSIAGGAFEECQNLVSVTMPNSVYQMGSDVFKNCKSLASIDLSDSLTSIPSVAFYGCSALTSIIIPDMVSTISADSFTYCSNLGSITVGANLTYVADNVFTTCRQLYTVNNGSLYINMYPGNTHYGYIAYYAQTVNGSNSAKTVGDYQYRCNTYSRNAMITGYTGTATTITVDSALIDSITYKIIIVGNGAFRDNISIENLIITNGVNYIESSAFSGCINLTSVAFSDTVYRIGSNAFDACESLTDLTFPTNLHNIDESAFRGCIRLSNVTFNSISCDLGDGVFSGSGTSGSGMALTYSDTVSVISAHGISDATQAPKVITISIGRNVSSIEDRAFKNFVYLTDVFFNSRYITEFTSDSKLFYNAGTSSTGIDLSFGSGIENLPDYMFYSVSSEGAPMMGEIEFGDDMTSIGKGAFSYCSGLDELDIPASITSIGDYAFYYCSGIDDLILSAGLVTIGESAFEQCTSIKSITLPDTVTQISDRAFYECTAASTLVLGTGVEHIGTGSFGYLEKIKSITIPQSVTYIGNNAFVSCILVTEINYNAEECDSVGTVFSATGSNTFGVTVNIGATVDTVPSRMFYMSSSHIIAVIFADGAEEIQERAFYGSDKLVNVTLPSTLQTIGEYAFCNCTAMSKIVIPNSVESIGNYAFNGCSNLSNLTLGSGLETIGNYAFNSSSIVNVVIPDSVTSIGSHAFSNLGYVNTITIGKGVTSIGQEAFSRCSNLTAIYFNAKDCCSFQGLNVFYMSTSSSSPVTLTFGGDAESVPAYFTNGTGYASERLYVSSITIGDTVNTIGDYAFCNSTALTALTLGAGLSIIGDSAFKGCTGLTSVTVQDNVWGIDDNAFSGCTSLATVNLGNSVQRFGDNAFNGCTALTSVQMPDTVLTVGDSAFYGCKSITSFRLSSNLTSLGARAFYNCTGITDVSVPSTLRTISEYSFGRCTSLSSLTIGHGVTTIETYAFIECTSLQSVYIPNSVTVIENNILDGCSSLRSVIIPDSVTDFGVRALTGVIFYDTDGETVISDPQSIKGYRYDGSNSRLTRSTDVPVIRWINGTEVLETDSSQKYGAVPSYDGLKPFKDNDDSYSYIFSGWSPSVTIVTGSIDYYATFEQIDLKYYVTYIYDGSRYGDIEYYDNGETVIVREIPEKTGYTVSAWSAVGATIVDGEFDMPDCCVYIYCTSTVNKYSIKFDTDGGSVIPDIVQDYQSSVTPPQDPIKIGYTFVEWSPEIPAVMPLDGLTVKAIWSINQYTIVFDSNGGSEVPSKTQDYKSAITVPDDPTKAGYTFVEWQPAVPETMPVGGITVVAVWSANSYTLTFDTDGGTPIEPITQEVFTAITFTGVTTKTGYVFAGWEPAIPDVMPVGGITVKAQWTLGSFTITFDTDGGSSVEPSVFYYQSTIVPPADPVKDGYTFTGWVPSLPETMPGYDFTVVASWTINQYSIVFNTNGGTSVSTVTQDYMSPIDKDVQTEREGYSFVRWVPAIPDTMPLNGITVTAEWSINQYTITFNSDGGTAVESITQDYATKVEKPASPTKVGYRFAGWSPKVPSTMPAENIELVAQWTVIKYTMVFNTAGGSSIPSVTQGYGTAITVPEDPVKRGYTFVGWDHTIPATMPLGGDTVTAVWAVNQYSMYFDNNDGSAVYSITQDFGTKITVPTPPQRPGYTFLGWSPSVPSVMNDTEATYTAKWLINTYTVQFDSNGGSAVSPLYYPYGASITMAPNDPYRAGYTFQGWYPSIPDTMPLGGCTVTAQWTPNQYTITFDTDGGSAVAPITQYCDTEITAPANPTKEGYVFMGWSPELPEKMTPYDLTVKAQWQKRFIESDIVVEGTTKKVSTDSPSAIFSWSITSILTNGSENVQVDMNGASIKMNSESFKKIAGLHSMVLSVDHKTGITQEKILQSLTEEQKAVASRAKVIDVVFTSYGDTTGLGTVSVSFAYTLPEGKTVDDIRVYCTSGDALEKMEFTYADGRITLYSSHLSSFAVCDAALENEPVPYTGMNAGLIAAVLVAVCAVFAVVAAFKK